jgi:hypothetical protein
MSFQLKATPRRAARTLGVLGALLGWLGTAAAQTASLTPSTTTYAAAAGTLTLTATINYPGLSPSALGYLITLPAGFSLVSVGGSNPPNVAPTAGTTGDLEFAYTTLPANAASFTVVVAYPAGLSGTRTITAQGTYRSPLQPLIVPAITLTGTLPATAPVIQRAPAAVTVTAGQAAQFSVEAAGTAPLSYQWRRDGTALTGATNNTLSLAAAQPADAGLYDVVVTNPSGQVTSATARLTVQAASTAPVILRGPTSVTVNAGQAIALNVEVTGTPPLLFQWRRDETVLFGASTAQLQIPAATPANSGSYVVVVSNVSGTAISAPAEVTVNVPAVAPAIVTGPTALSVAVGSPATFSVTASGSAPLTYQWRRDGVAISGATNRTLSLTAAQATDAGLYDVVVAGASGQVLSTPARLTVLAAPPTGGSDYFGQLPQGGAYALIRRPGQPGVFLAWSEDLLVASRQVPASLGSSFSFPAPVQGALRAAPVAAGTLTADGGLVLRLGTTVFPATAPVGGAAAGPGPGLHVLREAGTATTALLAIGETGQFLLAGRAAGQLFSGTGRIDPTGSVQGTTTVGQSIAGVHAAGPRTTLVRVARPGATELVLVGSDPDRRPALERLVNLSTRSGVEASGGGELITGFVVAGGGAKRLLLRAAGPSLGAFGVTSALPEPVLELYREGSLTATGRGWDRGSNAGAVAAAMTQAGAFPFPAGSADAALLPSLTPGAYTAAIRSGTAAGGITLAEAYDLESAEPTAARLVNLSARARGEAGERTFTAGFVVSGTLPKAVLIRGIGPALAGFGVTDAMSDPQLVLYRDGVVVARNTDWERGDDPAGVAAAAAAVGAFPLAAGARDAVILVNLYSGAYTVEVAPQSGGGGQVLAEVYEVP